MKNLSLITITTFFLFANNAYALCFSDSTKNHFSKDESIYIKKLELITLINCKSTVSLSIKSNTKKTAQILRIAALPFFVAALITNNSRDLSRGFLIAGAGIELTSLYFELHHRRTNKLSFQHD